MGVAGQDDELELQEQDHLDEGDPGGEPKDGDPKDPPEGDEGEEDVVQIGDEEPPASEEEKAAPDWVKTLRVDQKQLKKRQRELEQENEALKARLGGGQSSQAAPKLPEFPKIADYDYDEDKYQEAVTDWNAKKRAADREVETREASQKAAVDARQKAAQAVHEGYAKSKLALKVKDFQAAEDAVEAALEEVQQSILIAGASNSGAMVYALGTNPKKLAELASIKDPVKFAVAVGKLETEVKVTKRTSTKPPPESTVRTGTGSASTSSATLDRLEAEAAKTGDRSKVIAYKRQQKQSGK